MSTQPHDTTLITDQGAASLPDFTAGIRHGGSHGTISGAPRIAFATNSATIIGAAEKSTTDLHRVIRQSGATTEREIGALLQKVRASGKPPSAFIDKREALTPLEKAQDIMFEAAGANGRKPAKLARRALAVCPDCADAYVMLASEEDEPEPAKELFLQGIQAGERALKSLFGDNVIDERTVEFWGVLETRPYMRALAGLTHPLWFLGENEECIRYQQRLMELNPNDNQGIRHPLIAALLEVGRDDEADALLKKYAADTSAAMKYSRALWSFANQDRSVADRTLDDAFDSNPFIPGFMRDIATMPTGMPSYIEPGGAGEAIEYILRYGRTWLAREGAGEWMLKHYIRALASFADE